MANTVTMSLEKYDEIMARLHLLESAIIVEQPYTDSDYISLTWNEHAATQLVRERFNKLPYANQFEFDKGLYYCSTTVARRKQEDSE